MAGLTRTVTLEPSLANGYAAVTGDGLSRTVSFATLTTSDGSATATARLITTDVVSLDDAVTAEGLGSGPRTVVLTPETADPAVSVTETPTEEFETE